MCSKRDISNLPFPYPTLTWHMNSGRLVSDAQARHKYKTYPETEDSRLFCNNRRFSCMLYWRLYWRLPGSFPYIHIFYPVSDWTHPWKHAWQSEWQFADIWHFRIFGKSNFIQTLLSLFPTNRLHTTTAKRAKYMTECRVIESSAVSRWSCVRWELFFKKVCVQHKTNKNKSL